MKNYWTEQKKQELWTFWKRGIPIKSIAFKFNCTDSAIRHLILNIKKEKNLDVVHHPREKEKQIREILKGQMNLRILECFSGYGNLTKIYKTYGDVITIDSKIQTKKRNHILMDSFRAVHKLVSEDEYFDVIDIDSYGFPSRHFPHIFRLIKKGYLFVTFPYLSAMKNKITNEHLRLFWGTEKLTPEIIIECIQKWGRMYYRDVQLIDIKKFDRIYRFAFEVNKISAADMVDLQINR